jgi:hypothetical protein
MEEERIQEEVVEQLNEETNDSSSENNVDSASESRPDEAAPQESERRNDKNIRLLREEREKAQRERDELLQRLQAYENQKQEATKKADEPTLAPDDLVEWRVVQKEMNAVKQQLQQYQNQQDLSSTEMKLKSQFNDFDSVVSKENIEMLRTMEPELAASIHSNPNVYTKAVAAYKAIKKLGLGDKNALEKEKLVQNSARPRSSQAAAPQQSDSPLTKANAYGTKLDESSKKAIWEEMQRITGRSY